MTLIFKLLIYVFCLTFCLIVKHGRISLICATTATCKNMSHMDLSTLRFLMTLYAIFEEVTMHLLVIQIVLSVSQNDSKTNPIFLQGRNNFNRSLEEHIAYKLFTL